MKPVLFGAIEAGGTKFICAIGTASGEIVQKARIATAEPRETLSQVVAFFRPRQADLTGLGVGSFGPIQLDKHAANFGHITSTPKTAWRDFDLLGSLCDAFSIPIAIDTDVNAAAIAEGLWGAAQGLKTYLYITVGTGIGGGAVIDGSILHGLVHPEMGHIRVPHDTVRDPFRGSCPYHYDCLEGLASGAALQSRWGIAAENLPDDHTAWALESEYLAQACTNWICTISPERIIFGGGVTSEHLLGRVRQRTTALLNGYIEAPELVAIDGYIVASALGQQAGILGALALAARRPIPK